jgi:preprotein translocase subunit SecG
MPASPNCGRQTHVLMTFLLVIHGLLALALVGVILIQKSEGGGLTGGGSAGGLVSARGAANLLTRTTSVLAVLFIVSSLGLAWLAGHSNRPQTVDTSLARQGTPVGPLGAPVPTLPAPGALPAPSGAPLAPPAAGPLLPSDAEAASLPAPAEAPPVAN